MFIEDEHNSCVSEILSAISYCLHAAHRKQSIGCLIRNAPHAPKL